MEVRCDVSGKAGGCCDCGLDMVGGSKCQCCIREGAALCEVANGYVGLKISDPFNSFRVIFIQLEELIIPGIINK